MESREVLEGGRGAVQGSPGTRPGESRPRTRRGGEAPRKVGTRDCPHRGKGQLLGAKCSCLPNKDNRCPPPISAPLSLLCPFYRGVPSSARAQPDAVKAYCRPGSAVSMAMAFQSAPQPLPSRVPPAPGTPSGCDHVWVELSPATAELLPRWVTVPWVRFPIRLHIRCLHFLPPSPGGNCQVKPKKRR